MAGLQNLDGVRDLAQRFRIERGEALVQEERFQIHRSALAVQLCDALRQRQSQRQGRQERLAAAERSHGPGLAGIRVIAHYELLILKPEFVPPARKLLQVLRSLLRQDLESRTEEVLLEVPGIQPGAEVPIQRAPRPQLRPFLSQLLVAFDALREVVDSETALLRFRLERFQLLAAGCLQELDLSGFVGSFRKLTGGKTAGATELQKFLSFRDFGDERLDRLCAFGPCGLHCGRRLAALHYCLLGLFPCGLANLSQALQARALLLRCFQRRDLLGDFFERRSAVENGLQCTELPTARFNLAVEVGDRSFGQLLAVLGLLKRARGLALLLQDRFVSLPGFLRIEFRRLTLIGQRAQRRYGIVLRAAQRGMGAQRRLIEPALAHLQLRPRHFQFAGKPLRFSAQLRQTLLRFPQGLLGLTDAFLHLRQQTPVGRRGNLVYRLLADRARLAGLQFVPKRCCAVECVQLLIEFLGLPQIRFRPLDTCTGDLVFGRQGFAAELQLPNLFGNGGNGGAFRAGGL